MMLSIVLQMRLLKGTNRMTIELKIAKMFEVILQEMKCNQGFAKKVESIFNVEDGGFSVTTSSSERNDQSQRKMDPKYNSTASNSKKRLRKRNKAAFNPETLLEEQGERVLVESLNQLNIDQLKDIVSEFGMDPAKKVMKWKKKERFIEHIIEVAQNRLMKGTAFRRLN
nr:hypothetical protein [Lysinibacillus timonensis]